jgi:hypothetical protein
MNGTEAEKTSVHDASNGLEKKEYNLPPSAQDDAASSTYNNKDDVEKAHTQDTVAESVDDGAEKNEEKDPNVVDFDGDDDPECALNWSLKKKWTMGGLLSAMTFVTFVLKQHF